MEEIDLKELFSIFWEKKIRIIITVLIFAIIGGVYSIELKKPVYTSSTSLVLAQSQGDDSSSITSTDITLNSKLVSTYAEIITSKTSNYGNKSEEGSQSGSKEDCPEAGSKESRCEKSRA